ncbi:MAG: hypothetical protein BWY17_00250 [Deltaproteobacteria bacterium ADurb.Bin207]|jgi:hypothetical protein|nr:MAG: hypothetical protein BWY17_00250 [Deltaproteobacteria bacterium ADurb.Bin207]
MWERLSFRNAQDDTPVKVAVAVSLLLVTARFVLSESIGFGDAEALYASYSLFGQATYLDHPGLIGWLGSWFLNEQGVADPVSIHRFTSIAATAIPWLGGLAARFAGASARGAILAVLAIAIVPETAIGLFAFSPDLPLAIAWLGALGLAALALRSHPSSLRSFAATLGAGLCTGLACAAKVTGILLAIALVATWSSRPARERLRTFAPYFAVLLGIIVTLPMLQREISLGWPMLHHRLWHTQVGFGLTLRNVGALLGGQALYLTPFVAIAIVAIAIDLARQPHNDAVDRLLFYTTIPPFVALATLTILSRVAEPHWVAPAYLGLALHLGRRADSALVSRRLALASVFTSLLAIAVVFLVVRFPVLPKILGDSYDPKLDITNDLFAWKTGSTLVQSSLRQVREAGIDDVVVVGPHWVICAQVQAAIGQTAEVACETPEGDDFQQRLPKSAWERAPVWLYVTDDRFPIDIPTHFPNRSIAGVNRATVRRGGVVVRTIRVIQLQRMGAV